MSDKIKRSFRAVGFIYKAPKQGKLVDFTPGILQIRHARVMLKYRQWRKKYKTLTEEQISIKVAGFFNHSSDISWGYKRLTFDSLADPLATKQGLSSSSPAPAARPAAPLPRGRGRGRRRERRERRERRVIRRRQVNLGSQGTTQHTPAPQVSSQARRADSQARRAD